MTLTVGDLQVRIHANTRPLDAAIKRMQGFERSMKQAAGKTAGFERSAQFKNLKSGVQNLQRADRGLQSLRVSLGGAERSASRYEQAQRRVNAALRAGLIDQQRANNLLRQSKSRFSEAGFAARSFNGRMKGLPGPLGKVASAILAVASALGSKEMVQATVKFERITQALKFAAGSALQGAEDFQFLVEQSNRLGLNLALTGREFAKFAAATRGTSLAGDEAKRIFVAFAEASTVLGLSADETAGIFRALQQMISKGKVQAEELRGQLGERLPGAFILAAEAMGVTTQELDKMLEDGNVLAKTLLPLLATRVREVFGKDVVDASKNMNSNINRLATAFDRLLVTIGRVTGLTDLFNKALAKGSEIMDRMTSALEMKEAVEKLKRNLGAAKKFHTEMLGSLIKHLQELRSEKEKSLVELQKGPLVNPRRVQEAIRDIKRLSEQLKALKAEQATRTPTPNVDSMTPTVVTPPKAVVKSEMNILKIRKQIARAQRKADRERLKMLERDAKMIGEVWKELEKDIDEGVREANRLGMEDFREWKKVFDETRTPLEQYRIQMEKLREQLARGAIDQDMFNRKAAQLKDVLAETDPHIRIFTRGMEQIGDGIADALVSGESFIDGLKKAFKSGIDFILKEMFKLLIIKPILDSIKRSVADIADSGGGGLFGNLFGGGSLPGFGAGGSSLFSAGGLFSSTPTSVGVFGGFQGFANGGEFKVGGTGGTDSQFVGFRASPNETVSVKTPSQQETSGGMQVFIDATGADQAAFHRLEREVKNLNASIERRSVSAMVAERRRNPGVFS